MQKLLDKIRGEVRFSAIRSRGPGGQNVNKVSSAAQLKWDFMLSEVLTENQKNLVNEKLYNFINKNEELYLRSDEYRDLERNKERCLSKLGQLLGKAFHKPKARKKTKPTKASKKKRLDSKRQRSETKRNRRKIDY